MTKQVPFVPNCYSRKGIKVEMLLPVVASTKKSQHKEALPIAVTTKGFGVSCCHLPLGQRYDVVDLLWALTPRGGHHQAVITCN